MKKNDTKSKKEIEIIDPRWEKFFLFYAETGKVVESGIRAGFSENYANKLKSRYPEKVQKGLAEVFSDEYLTGKHKEQFEAGRLDQITFPLERNRMKTEDLVKEKEMLEKVRNYVQLLGGEANAKAIQKEFRMGYAKAARFLDLINEGDLDEDEKENIEEGARLTDKDIVALLAEVGCKVKRIVPMYGLRHVYFWTPDHVARDKALDKAYKIRGIYAPINSVNVNIDGNKLFTDEQRAKAKSAIGKYLTKRGR